LQVPHGPFALAMRAPLPIWIGPKGDRLIEVLQVAGRPLAISRSDHLRHIVHVDDGSRFGGRSKAARFQRWWGGRDSDVGMGVGGVAVLPRLSTERLPGLVHAPG